MLTEATTAEVNPRPAANRRLRRLAGLTLICLVVLGVNRHIRQTGQLPFLHRESVWSIAIYAGPTPFNLAPIHASNQPVLTPQDISDVRALFVADPFVVRHEDRWYMFIEVLNLVTQQGDIGLATSADGLTWDYEQIVIDEPFHMSYPSVFQHAGTWYMLPETEAAGCVHRSMDRATRSIGRRD